MKKLNYSTATELKKKIAETKETDINEPVDVSNIIATSEKALLNELEFRDDLIKKTIKLRDGVGIIESYLFEIASEVYALWKDFNDVDMRYKSSKTRQETITKTLDTLKATQKKLNKNRF